MANGRKRNENSYLGLSGSYRRHGKENARVSHAQIMRSIFREKFFKPMKPPKHLKKAAKDMWSRLIEDYEINDSAGLALLESACICYQRAEDARKQVRREGLTIKDRFEQIRPHPCCAIERDSRGQMVAALRALKLSPGD